ncbi:hypothetical protein QR680_011852 [Steinernema hermaphroditum]|uniref:Uncharacterized protein n=1 Tax=Steinernema hermaphroditum TaxID=289476 RepID=A0AA39I003_9BILA|nr:hypothetical protein QR680_011852 [Steinernema hermaphroditum]
MINRTQRVHEAYEMNHTTMVDWIVDTMPELPRDRAALKEPVKKIMPMFRMLSQAQMKAFPSETSLESMLCMFNGKQKKQYLPKILDAFEECQRRTGFRHGIYSKILWGRMAALFDLDDGTKTVANRAQTATSLAKISAEDREQFLNQFLDEVPKLNSPKGLEKLLVKFTGMMNLKMGALNLSTSRRDEAIDRKRKRTDDEDDEEEPAPKRRTLKVMEAEYKKLLEEKDNQIRKLKKLLNWHTERPHDNIPIDL